MTPTLSVVTTCMDRNDFLCQTLPTWVEYGSFDEIIIVDYSSKEPVKPIVDQYQNGRIILIEVPKQIYFNHSKARNVGFRYVSSEYVLMLDCDFKMIKSLTDNLFDGNCRTACHNGCGEMLLPTRIIRMVNGYNEYLCGWGFEDIDFAKRVALTGVKIYRNAIGEYVSHIDHSDELRTKNCISKNIGASNKNNSRASKHRRWSRNSRMEDMHEIVYMPPEKEE